MHSSDPFEPIELFAFPVFSALIAGWEDHQEGLIETILAHKDQHAGVLRSNRHAWHSGDEFVNVRSEHLAWLLQNVTTYARRALASYYDNWSTSELKLGHYWANVVGAGGWNAPHHHHPQHWSGCYYVRIGKIGQARDQSDTAGYIEFLNPFPIQSHWGGGSFAYAPRDGLQLLFPATLVHMVHPHDNEEDRISIAYNFNVVPRAGARSTSPYSSS